MDRGSLLGVDEYTDVYRSHVPTPQAALPVTALVIDSEAAPESVSIAVVTAVAEVLERDPTTIDRYTTLSIPEALERLFASAKTTAQGGGGRVTLPLEGCEVTVYANGRLGVGDPETLGRAGASD